MAVPKGPSAERESSAKEQVENETLALHGEDAAAIIVDQAEKLGADMIVMGRHGKRGGLKKLIMGSVTSKIIGHAPCKVLVVP